MDAAYYAVGHGDGQATASGPGMTCTATGEEFAAHEKRLLRQRGDRLERPWAQPCETGQCDASIWAVTIILRNRLLLPTRGVQRLKVGATTCGPLLVVALVWLSGQFRKFSGRLPSRRPAGDSPTGNGRNEESRQNRNDGSPPSANRRTEPTLQPLGATASTRNPAA